MRVTRTCRSVEIEVPQDSSTQHKTWAHTEKASHDGIASSNEQLLLLQHEQQLHIVLTDRLRSDTMPWTS